ncbi:MBL fold metallo-hydrolase [Virgibacillus litoralis]|uniref:Glyoxylase-like metal-dependent hydrolase (Beta-lactamase superfamily II) n=1 Tax=Virgibacillus litoralis TaxID=578221 RepID=A0ABS4H8B5_9BACI|nr:glyoxylase-like metal-dependent hydrolase (beta-lactamase superfamily II) [Virgibacillus litoralis]
MSLLEEYGLKQIKLDLPFRLNHVNCFIAEGEDGWKVIDAGLHNKETADKWDKELAGKKVTDILVTHYHPDHFGYVGAMQEKTGARVSMTKIDTDAGINAWQESFIRELAANYSLAGVPNEIANSMTTNTNEFVSRVTPYPNVNHYFQEGEMIPIGNYEYEVIFTPGHSEGLITFYNKEKNMLLSTDHILPKITPNISYWFHGDPNPLATYLASLEKIKKLDVDFVVPSHGQPFHGANDRIDEIKTHHDHRLEQTLESISGGSTVYDTCQRLFSKKLTIHEMRFAIGETLSHLEYLRYKGECKRDIKDGTYWYEVRS